MSNKGIFISLEGSEGVGKSTQVKLLEDYFLTRQKKVITLQEPGGTKLGTQIATLVKHSTFDICNESELLLFIASRAQLIKEIIIPKLEENYVIICDRFIDSTLAYQGYGRAMDKNLITTLHKTLCYNLFPNKTFLLLSSLEESLTRAKIESNKQNLNDRFEKEHNDFHTKVINGFLNLQQNSPERIVRIDANKSIEQVHQEIISHL